LRDLSLQSLRVNVAAVLFSALPLLIRVRAAFRRRRLPGQNGF
jgi:hypothetical protein